MHFPRSLSLCVVAAMTLGVAAVAQPQTGTLARCQLLVETFDRYYSKKNDGLGSTGSRLDRDIAEAQCERGQVDEGIRGLEGAMRRNNIPIPPG